MKLILAGESTASRRRVFFQLVDATDGITAETGEAGGQPQIAINGDIVTGSDRWVGTGYIGTLTHIGNGRYYAELDSQTVATAGTQIETRYKSANTAECPGDSVQVVAFNPNDSVRLGLTALPNAAAEASGGLITRGTGTGQISLSSGAVTVGTNNDKTGYSLTQSFPSNFASLAITAGGAVTAGTVSDKTGYSLSASQTFDLTGNITGNLSGSVGSVTTGVSLANNAVNTSSIQNGAITNVKFAAGAITSAVFATDAITSTVIATDAITSAELASSSVNEIADTIWGANVDTNSSGSAWGGNTFGRRSLRTTTGASYEVQVTNTNHISASVHEMQSGVVTASSIAAGAIDANAIAANAIDASALAADAIAEIADGVWDEQLSGHLTAGSTGEALNDAGGAGQGATTVRMGPFTVKAEGQASDLPLDINKGATHGIDCKLVDAQGTGVDLTGATLSTKVYSTSGTLVATISGTATYEAGGDMTWTIPTSVTNTAGTYTATITRTTGASDTEVFGPLRIYVRDI